MSMFYTILFVIIHVVKKNQCLSFQRIFLFLSIFIILFFLFFNLVVCINVFESRISVMMVNDDDDGE